MFLDLLKYLLAQDVKPKTIVILFSLLPTLLGVITMIGAMSGLAFFVWPGFFLIAAFLRDIYRISFKFRAFMIPMIICVFAIALNVLFLVD